MARNFIRHHHWAYSVKDPYYSFFSDRYKNFYLKNDCLPSYQFLEEAEPIDWVDVRIVELEGKAANIADASWDIDIELSDCYYYSMTRRLLRKCDAIPLTECAFEKRGQEPDITAGICITRCEANICNYKR